MLVKVYHISFKKNRNSILKSGLITAPKKEGRIRYSPRIFVSINKKDLGFDFVDYENVDCWKFEVDFHLLKKDPFSSSKNHFYIEKNIIPEKVKLVHSF